MTTDLQSPPGSPSSDEVRIEGGPHVGDRIFRKLAVGAGYTIMVTLAAVFVFLGIEGLPDFAVDPSFYDGKGSFLGLVVPLVFGTTYAAILALLLAVPFAIGIALCISHYAPRRIATPVGYVMDLLAAIPSVVFGLWGGQALGPYIQGFHTWLHDVFGWLPFFSSTPSSTGRTLLTASIVLAIMILPIITSLCRDIFAQTPRLNEEAALALGATRWEMIRLAVFPYAKSGMVSAIMLGLGRALGETMALAMVVSSAPIITLSIIGSENPVRSPLTSPRTTKRPPPTSWRC